jgi:uncharacterized phage protein (TIGR02220 family)
MSFWTDTKVSDDFTPEEKLMYLYLLTNPHTNLCGCYEVSVKQMSMEIGQTVEKTRKQLISLQDNHKVLIYSDETKEVLLLNWSKYNWTKSDKFEKPLLREIESIKSEEFKGYLYGIWNGEDTVSIPYPYRIDTSVTDTDTVTVSDTVSVPDADSDTVTEVIDYLNTKAGTSFRSSSKSTKGHIKARLKEGYTLTDFKTVIDNKVKDWKGTDMSQYLRPETLFGSKFEAYLNQQQGTKKVTKFDNFTASGTDWDAITQQIMSKQGG